MADRRFFFSLGRIDNNAITSLSDGIGRAGWTETQLCAKGVGGMEIRGTGTPRWRSRRAIPVTETHRTRRAVASGFAVFGSLGEGHAPATADDVLLFPSSSAPEARTATGAARPRLRCEAGLAALPARREATFVRLARDSILEGPCDQCGDDAHRSRGKILPSRICIGLITRRLIRLRNSLTGSLWIRGQDVNR